MSGITLKPSLIPDLEALGEARRCSNRRDAATGEARLRT